MTASPAREGDWDFLVDRHDLRRTLVREAAPADLAAGEVDLRVDAFALTSNNLTYAVTGDRFGYWQLFPAEGPWGRIPAWGVGTVAASACPEVAVGERFAGLLPMSTHMVARPQRTRDGFADRVAHRDAVNPVYNRYTRVTGRDDAELERDAALRPVYILSFVLAHHLRSRAFFGATRVLVTSASSKASLGLAHLLSDDRVTVVGLTSAAHRDVVQATGLYDDVVVYERVDDLTAEARSVFVDVSGNGTVRDAVRTRLGRQLVRSVHVGQTDWEQPASALLGGAADAPAFFAPTEIQRLVSQWGSGVFAARLDDDLRGFVDATRDRLHADHRDGAAALCRAFDDVAAGAIGPDRFVIVRP